MFNQVAPSLLKNIPVDAVTITPSAYVNVPKMFVVPPVGCAGVTSPTLYFVYPFIRLYPPSVDTSKFLKSFATPGVLSKSITSVSYTHLTLPTNREV